MKESNLKNESTYLSPSHDTSLNDDLSIANNDPPPRLVPVRTIVWLGKYISAIWRNRFLIKNTAVGNLLGVVEQIRATKIPQSLKTTPLYETNFRHRLD